MADMIRKMGPFQPHRLPEAMLEYTTVPEIMAELKERFVDVEKK